MDSPADVCLDRRCRRVERIARAQLQLEVRGAESDAGLFGDSDIEGCRAQSVVETDVMLEMGEDMVVECPVFVAEGE